MTTPEHDLEQLLYVHSSALTYFDWTVILIYARGMNYTANRDRNKQPDVIHTKCMLVEHSPVNFPA
jgi:hypothetical protein